MLTPYIILIALVVGMLFLFVSMKYKILLAIVVMSSCFDLVEHIIGGIDLWDVGIIMLFIAYLQLLLTSNKKRHGKLAYEKILIVFVVWMLIEFAWSLYHYPLIPTVKTARQLLLGYMTYFVYVSFFKSQNYEVEPFFRLLFRVVFLFVVLFVVQSFLHFPVLKSLTRDYEGLTRSIPGFLAYALLFTWLHLVRYFSGEKLSVAEYVYLALMVVVIMGTYTRSVYFGVMIIICTMIIILIKDGKLQPTKFTISCIVTFMAFVVLVSTGELDKMISRTLSGLQLITGDVGQNFQERKKRMTHILEGCLLFRNVSQWSCRQIRSWGMDLCMTILLITSSNCDHIQAAFVQTNMIISIATTLILRFTRLMLPGATY